MELTLEGAVARANHLADTAAANIRDGKVVLKTNMEDEVNNYLRYRQSFMNSAETTLNEATQTFVDANALDDFEIVDNDDEMGKTMFGMTMIKRADEMFTTPKVEEKVEEKVETVDNVSDNSFIISKDELPTLNPEVRPEENLSLVTPTLEPEVEEYEGEVVSFEEERTKSKVKTLGKRAAYVDTVILCLIAQLSIFGLLIIVLLIIK
nr:hypothetical protein [Bacilli bacterium]